MNNERLALQKHLLGIITASEVEWEGDTDFVAPDLSTPYYKAYLLRGKPINLALDTMDRGGIGIFQVTMMYPINQGTIPLETMAQTIIDHFVGQSLVEGNAKVTILEQPEYTKLDDTNDRFIGMMRIIYKTTKI